jgi:hypothetical protein
MLFAMTSGRLGLPAGPLAVGGLPVLAAARVSTGLGPGPVPAGRAGARPAGLRLVRQPWRRTGSHRAARLSRPCPDGHGYAGVTVAAGQQSVTRGQPARRLSLPLLRAGPPGPPAASRSAELAGPPAGAHTAAAVTGWPEGSW